MYETVHGFNLEQANAVFAALSIGALLATLLSMYQERIAARFGKSSNTPEGRLYYACVESILLPIGLFWYVISTTLLVFSPLTYAGSVGPRLPQSHGLYLL